MLTKKSNPAPVQPTILLVDNDAAASRELGALLLDRLPGQKAGPPRLYLAAGVAAAAETIRDERLDWLFIRITEWDAYQHIAFASPLPPPRVVFLSGRAEKCTEHLPLVVDAHLQPPYNAGRLAKIWNRLTGPGFDPRPLDFFFLKNHALYETIRYRDLQQVRKVWGELRVQTRDMEYRMSGSLNAFQERLPIPLARVRRGWLVNE